MNAIKRLVLVCIISCSVAGLNAQMEHYHYEAGISTGTFLYQGDLVRSPFGSFNGAKPMVQLWVSKPFTPYLSWRANLAIGSISADESAFAEPFWKQLRNFSFSTPVTEFTALVQYNFYGDNGKETYHTLTPYIMAGAGISFLNIHRDWSQLNTIAFDSKSSTQIGLGIDTLHALPSVLPVIPLGAGVRWSVSPTISVNAEATMRLSFSDYIDGFSYAAYPKAKDSYYSLSLGMSFMLGGNGVKCPRVGR